MSPEIVKQKVDQTLIALRQANPQATVAAIVRTAEAAEAHRAEVEATGLAVQRVFRLVPGLAVEGKVTDVLALADRPWVRSISLDREVHAMREPDA
ncbi:MAG: hypothetical protein KAX80_01665 [Planctomycetes bacterium]|nr:hypothetical protein [Planctomycetota bacterium]